MKYKNKSKSFKYLVACVVLVIFNIHIGSTFLSADNFVDTIDVKSYTDEFNQISNIEKEQQKVLEKVKIISNYYRTNMKPSLVDSLAYEIYSMKNKYPTVDINLICSHISTESAWQTNAISTANAKGLMQIVGSTGAYLALSEGYDITNLENLLYNPLVSVRLGTRYLYELHLEHGFEGSIVGYNSGPKYAALYDKKRDATLLPKETQGYLPKVLRLYNQYRTM